MGLVTWARTELAHLHLRLWSTGILVEPVPSSTSLCWYRSVCMFYTYVCTCGVILRRSRPIVLLCVCVRKLHAYFSRAFRSLHLNALIRCFESIHGWFFFFPFLTHLQIDDNNANPHRLNNASLVDSLARESALLDNVKRSCNGMTWN